jgi:hypothetical protein
MTHSGHSKFCAWLVNLKGFGDWLPSLGVAILPGDRGYLFHRPGAQNRLLRRVAVLEVIGVRD